MKVTTSITTTTKVGCCDECDAFTRDLVVIKIVEVGIPIRRNVCGFTCATDLLNRKLSEFANINMGKDDTALYQ